MGNVLSGLYNTSECVYTNYYPKNKWLQPRYVAPTLMGANVLWLMFGPHTPLKQNCNCNNTTYLFSASILLGVQFWKSFVDPSSLKVLPRHMQGLNQSHLFPKYFFVTTLFSYGTLAAFLKVHPLSDWKAQTLCLGSMMLGSFVLNALNLTCFGVNAIKYNLKMHEIEKAAGEGVDVVGPLPESSQLHQNPEYSQVKRAFFRFHAYCTLANFSSLVCTLGQFYFLSKKSFL